MAQSSSPIQDNCFSPNCNVCWFQTMVYIIWMKLRMNYISWKTGNIIIFCDLEFNFYTWSICKNRIWRRKKYIPPGVKITLSVCKDCILKYCTLKNFALKSKHSSLSMNWTELWLSAYMEMRFKFRQCVSTTVTLQSKAIEILIPGRLAIFDVNMSCSIFHEAGSCFLCV